MAPRISDRVAGALLVMFTAVAWGVAFAEWFMAGRAEPVALATCVMFTAMLVAWPFLRGTRLTTKDAEDPCGQCGAVPRVAFVRFCIYCGAFPKTPNAAATAKAAA